jgi:hypothetical protein
MRDGKLLSIRGMLIGGGIMISGSIWHLISKSNIESYSALVWAIGFGIWTFSFVKYKSIKHNELYKKPKKKD